MVCATLDCATLVWATLACHTGLPHKPLSMATNRLEILKQMISQDPNNSFARYGLAMELANSGELQHGVAEFRTLLERDENYAAAYFHFGQALEKLGDIEEARAVYEKVIEVTTRKGDLHTRSEIEEALNLLPV
jgi:tetratricopeptide (TPR) repeat protein